MWNYLSNVTQSTLNKLMNALVSKQTVVLDWGGNETQKFAFP